MPPYTTLTPGDLVTLHTIGGTPPLNLDDNSQRFRMPIPLHLTYKVISDHDLLVIISPIGSDTRYIAHKSYINLKTHTEN